MKKRKNADRKKHSFILSLALLLVAGYFVIGLVQSQLDIREKQNEIAAKEAQEQQLSDENACLTDIVNGGDQSAYMERVARDKLGMARRDEKVICDITPSN